MLAGPRLCRKPSFATQADRLRPRLEDRRLPSRWTCSATPCGPLASTTRSTSTTTSPPASATTGRVSTAACGVVEARCAGADVADAADGDGILRHRPGAARRTRRARTRDVRFVKGGVARAGCRRRGRAGGNRSGAADLAAVLVTYHRRGRGGPLASESEKRSRSRTIGSTP